MSLSFNTGLIDYIISKYSVPDKFSIYNKHTYQLDEFSCRPKFFDHKKDPILAVQMYTQYREYAQKELDLAKAIDCQIRLFMNDNVIEGGLYDANKIFFKKHNKKKQPCSYEWYKKVMSMMNYY